MAAKEDTANAASMSTAEIAFAVLIPIILVSALMTLFIFCRRRRRRTERTLPPIPQEPLSISQRANNYFRSLQRSFCNARLAWQNRFDRPSSASANSGQRSNDTTMTSTHIRSTGRRSRPRRTDSESSVKTLPEYNELGDDEVMLFKAISEGIDISVQDLEEGNAHSHSGSQRSSNQVIARQSSLSTVADLFRRISLRRTSVQETESNEMAEVTSREAAVAIPEDDTPEYSNLYPTVPPQVQVTVDDSADQRPQRLTASNSGRSIVRSLFRRGGHSNGTQDTLLSRVNTNTNDTSIDLRLVPTRSNDLSLYRPSTSSSRRMLGNLHINASSASLLSQSGFDSSDSRSTLSRPRHQRNISAPISASARRLQFAPPAAGFSERQMQFLNSVESLGRYGFGIPVGSEIEEVPPSFEQLARREERDILPTTRSAPILTPAELYADEASSHPFTIMTPITDAEMTTSPITDAPTSSISVA